MIDKKNIILVLGNKEFNNSLIEIRRHLEFNIEVLEDYSLVNNLHKYQGIIIYDDSLKNKEIQKVLKNDSINKIIFYNTKNYKFQSGIEKLELPATIQQINQAVKENIIKRKFKFNSSLKISDYTLDKNSRKLIKNGKIMELTEKEIELIELLNKRSFIKKKEILSFIWKYSEDADTHTVETHIYRLRKKIKEVFNDDNFIKSEKKGYTI